MSHRLAAAFYLFMLLPALGAEPVWQESFDTASPPFAGSIEKTPDRGGTLHVAVPAGAANPGRTISIPLPVDKLKGQRVFFSADVKMADVSKKPNSWNGVKVMLVVSTPSGKSYPQPEIPIGTHDWQKFSSWTAVPNDATNVALVLGLEQVSGEAWFDNARVVLRPAFRASRKVDSSAPIFLGHDLPRLRGAMAGNSLNEEDVKFFGTVWKGNLLRLQIFESAQQDRPLHQYDAWLDERLSYIDRVLGWCEKYGVHAVIDLHSPPGGQAFSAGYITARGRIFTDPKAQDKFIEVWQKMARRYQGRKIIWGFDLVNEPDDSQLGEECLDWNSLADKAARAVHEVDPGRTLIIEPNLWGGPQGFASFEPLDLTNVVYSFHFYQPMAFTHQGIHGNPTGVTYPGQIGGEHWDKDALERAMSPALEFAKKHRVHMYVGEFSAIRTAPGNSAATYLSDLITILEKHGFDWSYHAYREWQGWSAEHEGPLDQPRKSERPTAREKVLTSWFAKNTMAAAGAKENQDQPRIVNIYNFIRNTDFRLQNSEELMFECTQRQIELLKSVNLPATWALQHDALINARYPKLLKEQLGTNDEIAMWWEIPRQLAEKAGLKWRGRHDWDPEAHVGFSPGYTPEERRKLVDVYMADFKEAFGFYPKTVGSWFIDEVTLEYMAEKYGLIASCNCKDQIGTDFYTLWGGYWNQAYYPSRVNSYMPAQTREGQIDMPIFRMLGSDPIYQHGTTPGLISLEPVYRPGGGTPEWVDWFMDNLVEQPSLAFAYTQAGQENSFTWDPVRKGLDYQFKLFAKLVKTGKIRVETLDQSGRWFRSKFPLTPPTSMVALDDWKNEGRKTVWYNSRYYRLNVLWEKDTFFIRDIHCFDEKLVSPTHTTPLKHTTLTYETLPIVDWAVWSDSGRTRAGMWPVRLGAANTSSAIQPDGLPVVKELNPTDLRITQALKGGGTFSIICREGGLEITALDAEGKPLKCAFDIAGGNRLRTMVKQVYPTSIALNHSGVDYQLVLGPNGGSCSQAENTIRLAPNDRGTLVLQLDTDSVMARRVTVQSN